MRVQPLDAVVHAPTHHIVCPRRHTTPDNVDDRTYIDTGDYTQLCDGPADALTGCGINVSRSSMSIRSHAMSCCVRTIVHMSYTTKLRPKTGRADSSPSLLCPRRIRRSQIASRQSGKARALQATIAARRSETLSYILPRMQLLRASERLLHRAPGRTPRRHPRELA